MVSAYGHRISTSHTSWFQNPDLVIGLQGNILITCRTAVGLFLIAMCGYALQRPDFMMKPHRLLHLLYNVVLEAGTFLSADGEVLG